MAGGLGGGVAGHAGRCGHSAQAAVPTCPPLHSSRASQPGVGQCLLLRMQILNDFGLHCQHVATAKNNWGDCQPLGLAPSEWSGWLLGDQFEVYLVLSIENDGRSGFGQLDVAEWSFVARMAKSTLVLNMETAVPLEGSV